MTVARSKRRLPFVSSLNSDLMIDIFKIKLRVIRGVY
jgi:hypothetical protein